MILDILTLVILLWAVYKGISKGLLMAVFSLVAFVAGLAAALKLSAITASRLEGTVNVSARWLPVLAFLLVFIGVTILVNLIGKLLEKSAEWAFLGWLNKAGGVLFFAVLYLLVWSIVLFYLDKLELLNPDTMTESNTYAIIVPWGPRTINWLAELVPVFKNVFEELGIFFDRLSDKVNQPPQVAFL
ncbi:CvpA family protein [Flavihumibacter stibioxidans]|uniref:Membrane protein required for colicin V production n=1 Tax=Flavihumibacter stibioxidans TaxID=1834163 RepID=A0ABR7M961_9BACT|nr:CvpA family protein [Flavihumibacter stibioxidans]MBC6491166.1 hypothetical protein [Flavihumibacter stibioxidans]